MNNLFTAKWNIPQAVVGLGMASTEENWEAVKEMFAAYCKARPAEYQGD